MEGTSIYRWLDEGIRTALTRYSTEYSVRLGNVV